MFDIQNMVKIIKNIDGITISNEDILNGLFEPIIIAKNIKRGETYICFDKTRSSKVMNYEEHIYVSLTKFSFHHDTKSILLSKIDKIVQNALCGISLSVVLKPLLTLVNNDVEFDYILKEKFKNEKINNKEIFVELLIYCLKLEYNRHNEVNRVKVINNKVNFSIIRRIVEEITSQSLFDKNSKIHLKAWSINEKIQRNKIDHILENIILDAFSDYEKVMTILDQLSENNVMTSKYVYSYYQMVYFKVLVEMFNDEITDDKILSKSSTIFMNVINYIYNDLLLSQKLNIEYEICRYNLLVLTVSVFYQCKFLLPVEE